MKPSSEEKSSCLPSGLPKQNKKKEADFTTKIFRPWLLAQPHFYSAAFELKQTGTNSLSFSAVKDHQVSALLAVRGNGLLFKIPDDSRGQKCFDMFFMKNDEAYVVIRYPKAFVLIDIDAFIDERKRSSKKSLILEKAKEIATEVILIGKNKKEE